MVDFKYLPRIIKNAGLKSVRIPKLFKVTIKLKVLKPHKTAADYNLDPQETFGFHKNKTPYL